ncbi:hypothetical protein HMPREF9194_00353 [Treponema maltophilum ATCC 51939]|uniref:Uncharacterized protein n=1 Tax=Treponema maltophilum ATCC 51939 TaxID=1125699 RepID=S3K4A5_TREMA|nr:hypothetical protein [Treponema maltophilum]EPF32355.1 hypothetical protein HMPREF9194_00353 [Treponema maltophilum ATCC 51939]
MLNKKLMEYFHKYFIEERKYIDRIEAGDFSSCELPGFSYKLFSDKNSILIQEIIPNIRENTTEYEKDIKNSFFKYLDECIYENNRKIKETKENYKSNLSEFKDNNLRLGILIKPYQEGIDIFNELKKINTATEIITYYTNYFEKIKNNGYCDEDADIYAYYRIFENLYRLYKLEKEPELDYISPNKLENIYSNNGISLFENDKMYSQWNLLTFNPKYMTIKELNPPRIYDKRINSLIYPKNMNLESLKLIKNSIATKEIVDFSFRPNYFSVGENQEDGAYSMEELEFGKKIELSNLNENIVSKLYSTEFDTLWVKKENNEIIFEELPNKERYYHDDSIVFTRMVHLVFFQNENCCFIKHIDYELIYYSIDEYIARLDDVKQKGTIKKRNKIFKIDNSRIPLLKDKDTDFLIHILYTYFEFEELITEYFEKI